MAPPPTEENIAKAKEADEDEGKVQVSVPESGLLITDDTTRTEVRYNPGIQMMRRAHAEHWWAKARGVTIVGK